MGERSLAFSPAFGRDKAIARRAMTLFVFLSPETGVCGAPF
jgi:hypothetical protein